VFTLPLFEGFSVLGKAGGMYWSVEQDFVMTGTPVSQTISGANVVLRFGAQYCFNRHFASALSTSTSPIWAALPRAATPI
jgi:hypothetical protein